MGTQGFSPRTRSDAQAIRIGEASSRVSLKGARGGTPVEVRVDLSSDAPKQAWLNGARLAAAEQLRRELATLVFTPDRLAVVKGPPAVRRAYFDRALGRLSPVVAALPAEYAATVGQRNAALRRAAHGSSSLDAVAPWTRRVSELGERLTEVRREAVAALDGPFRDRAAAFGLQGARLVYDAEAPSVAALEARLQRDLERGATGLGPHLEDVAVLAGSRDLRSFGSQGEQRVAVLSLLLAEADLVERVRGVPPLLLLDDVLSELDADRRSVLSRWLPDSGQALITATEAIPLGREPNQLVTVSPGSMRSA